MANRWSPSVVAEAPPPVRSALGTALDVGYGVYKDRRAERLAREQREEARGRYEEELGYRNRNEARGVAATEEAGRLGDMLRETSLIGAGYSRTKPTFRDPTDRFAEPEPEPAILQGEQGWEPQEAPPPLRAGNTGPGGAHSETAPNWVIDEYKRVKNEAQERFGNDGSIAVRDPRTGETWYANPRQKWVDEQIKDINDRWEKSKTKIETIGAQDRDRDLDQDNALERIRASAAAAAGRPVNGMSPEDARVNREFTQINTEIDNMRGRAASLSRQADDLMKAGKRKDATAVRAHAIALTDSAGAREAEATRIRQGGPDALTAERQQRLQAAQEQQWDQAEDMLRNPDLTADERAAIISQLPPSRRSKYMPRSGGGRGGAAPAGPLPGPRRPTSPAGRSMYP